MIDAAVSLAAALAFALPGAVGMAGAAANLAGALTFTRLERWV